MTELVQHSNGMWAERLVPSVRRALVLVSVALLFSGTSLLAQCPNDGQTKVIKPSKGTGYYFYRFLGESSFFYFIDGKTFSFNEKDDPGKTFILIDDIAYESTLADRADLAKYVSSAKPIDILRAQAKRQQEYFKKIIPSMVIKDYGASARKSADGVDDRIFYLWKKENPPGSKEAAPQYLVSTLIKGGVVVLSLMPTKDSVSEEDVFSQIEKYTSRFDLASSERCAKVLSAATAH